MLLFHQKRSLKELKRGAKVDAEEYVSKLDNLKKTDVVNELNALHNKGIEVVDPHDISGCIRGRHNLYNHLESTLKNAEKSVDIMTTEKEFIRKTETLKPVFKNLHKKGVKIRIAAPINNNNKDSVDSISKYAEVRNSKGRGRFTVVDNKDVVFMVNDDAQIHPSYDVGIWVNTEFFSSALSHMFNHTWEKIQ